MQTQNAIQNRGLDLRTQLMFGIYAPIVSIGVAYAPRILEALSLTTPRPIQNRSVFYNGCYSNINVGRMVSHGDQERWNECFFKLFFLIVGALFLGIVIIDLIIKCYARPVAAETTSTQIKKKE